MQATTLSGFVLKRELNHVNREKSMNTLCSPTVSVLHRQALS